MDFPTAEDNAIPVLAMDESYITMRIYFILLFSVALAISCFLWKKISSVEDDDDLSLRGKILLDILIFLNAYCSSWLPIFFIGILDGQLETASVSTGFKGQIANLHCSIQDLLSRSFCMSIVVTSVIYLRYGGTKKSHESKCESPNIFLFGTFIPVTLVQVMRMTMGQEEWLMPTNSIIRYLESVHFSVKTTPAFCVQKMNASWIRQVFAEWFVTAAVVVLIVHCLHGSCFFRRKDSKSNPQQSSDSEAEDSSELQMESLLEDATPPVKGMDQPPSESFKSKFVKPARAEQESVSVKECGFLEAVMFTGVVWAVIGRPFMAIAFYIKYTDIYSNNLDIPSHVLMMIGLVVLSFDIWSTSIKDKAKAEDSREILGNAEEAKSGENDDDVIWIIDEDEGKAYAFRNDNDGDVDPIWIQDAKEPQNDDQKSKDSSVNNVSSETTENERNVK